MSVLVDASVFVALLTREPDWLELSDQLLATEDGLCCAVGLWEAARAIARKREVTAGEALQAVDRVCRDYALRLVATGAAEARLAIEAHDRYGKGTGHPAQLNMGDCFAYACAKANDARLLYKGDDFAKTDLA